MAYGIVEYDKQGLPKCEFCGQHFARVVTHVRQKHGINEREYKKQFGFNVKKGICSKESSKISREQTLAHYHRCIEKNLLEKGSVSRFKKGHLGRPKSMLSEQTRLALKERLKDPVMMAKMRRNGNA